MKPSRRPLGTAGLQARDRRQFNVHKFLNMWKYPRLVAWFVAAMLLFFVIRLPFFRVPLLYEYVGFNPGIILVPLLGVFWGPAGALGVTVSSLVGDFFLGYNMQVAVFRAVGIFFFSLSAKELWDYACSFDQHARPPSATVRHNLLFMACALPGAFMAACWTAVGCHLTRAYPFAYILVLVLLNHLVFLLVLGPAAFYLFARELVPKFGSWRAVLAEHEWIPVLSHLRVILSILAGGAAVVLGYLVDTRLFAHDPFMGLLSSQFVLGTAGGWQVTLPVLLLLLVKAAALCWFPKRKAKTTPRKPILSPLGSAVLMLCVLPMPGQAAEEASNLDEVMTMRRTAAPALPDAAELLQQVRETLPMTPLRIQAELLSRTSADEPANAYLVDMHLAWHPYHPRAEYLIRDTFGSDLHRLVLEPAREDLGLVYEKGRPPEPAALGSLDAEIEDTNFTWLDLSFSFLWWDRAETVGTEEVKGRACFVVDLAAPPGTASETAGMRLWIEAKVHVMMRAAAFDAEGHELRRMDVKTLKKIDGLWTVKDIDVRNARTGTRTRLVVRSIERE